MTVGAQEEMVYVVVAYTVDRVEAGRTTAGEEVATGQ